MNQLPSTVRRTSAVALALILIGAPTRLTWAEEGPASGAAVPGFTGLSAAPEAHLFTGAATTAIPIDVPPGRKNLTPALALTYSSGGGPSPYGRGWDLPIGRVERSRRRGVLSCNDLEARREFSVHLPSGSVECRLETNIVAGRQRCRPRVEDSYLQIYHVPDQNLWLAWDRNGNQFTFGDDPSARTHTGTQQAWSAPPYCRYTQSWQLTRLRDGNDNHIDFAYVVESGHSYPIHVRYGGNLGTGFDHILEVRFLWLLPDVPDRQSGIGAGMPAHFTRILDRIEVRRISHGTPVRTYRFRYDFSDGGSARLGRSGLLQAVTLFGRNGTALARYDGQPAATIFRYREATPDEQGFLAREPYVAPPTAGKLPTVLQEVQSTATRSHTLVALRDMNGDGILDLVDSRDCTAGAFPYWKVYFGTPNGFRSDVRWWMTPAAEADRCRISSVRHVGTRSETIVETMDVNGDGIPDWIRADQTPWVVYFGAQARTDVEWGFGPMTEWPTPPQHLPAYAHVIRGTDDGSDWIDLIDWNGDGLPDLVNARSGVVHYNTGIGFETEPNHASFPAQRLRHVINSRQTEGVFDMNGDGFPDFVRTGQFGGWQVHQNNGRTLTSGAIWTVPDTCSRDIRDKRGGKDTWRDLIDINGDGLPDLVDTCAWTNAAPYWQVYLNRGTHFRSEPVLWQAPHARIRHETGSSTVRVHRDVVDTDGDGFADVIEVVPGAPQRLRVHHNAAGAYALACGDTCVAARSDMAPMDALVLIDNGLGATTKLAYLPSTVWDNSDSNGFPRLPGVLWTVTRIEQDGGLAGVITSQQSRRLDLRYAYGLYHSPTREFRGFGTVQAIEADGTIETTTFGQSRANQGRVLSVTVHAPGKMPGHDPPLRATLNTWQCFDAATGVVTVCHNMEETPASMGVRLAQAEVRDYGAGGTMRRAWRKQLSWSPYGLPLQVQVGGDDSATFTTTTQYVQVDDLATGGSNFHVAAPARVAVTQSATLEEWWMFYDGLGFGQLTAGNVTRVESWIDSTVVPAAACSAAPTRKCVATHMAYDARGNVIGVTDAKGQTTTTAYSPDGLYPVRVVNPLGHVTESGYDVGCGKQLWETLPNASERTTQVYDDFCRQIATLLPGQSAASAQLRISYYLGGPGVATNIYSRRAAPSSPTGWIETDDLYDALGRRVQRQQAATVDGARVILATETVRFDGRGRGVASRAPFPITQAFAGGAALYRSPPAGETTAFEYDPLDRIVRVVRPDGRQRRVDYATPWQTAATGECFHSSNCAGSRTVKINDAHGNTVEKQIFDEAGALLSKTRYSHDFAGRVTQTEQWDGSRWQSNTRIKTTYDSLGRQLRIDDPDSGVWEFGYDHNGNLIHQDDPVRGRHIELCYDSLNRLTQKHIVTASDTYGGGQRCQAPGAAAAQLVYDDPNVAFGIGRLARVEDTTGATHFRAYDVRGNVTETTKSIRVGTYLESATTRFRYDRAGHLASVFYPDGEELAYEYDDTGNVRALYSRTDGTVYLADLTYDKFGRPRQITHGNGPGGIGVTDTREYAEAAGDYRLARLTTSARPGALGPCSSGAALLDLRYVSYTANGRVTRIEEDAGACQALANTATYRYDAMGRLIEVDGAQQFGRYTYDALGNMAAKDGRAFRFPANRPHRISHIDGAAVVKHDDNGNRTQKPGFTYEFDAEDRLVSINGGAVRVAYDYSGRQVLRTAGTITTRYFDELSEFRIERGEPILKKHYFAGELRVASREAVWQPGLSDVDPGRGWAEWRDWLYASAARTGLASLLGLAMIGLLVFPERRRAARPAGRGTAIATLCLYLSAQLTTGVAPAWAGGGPGSNTAPLPTVLAQPVQLSHAHYHVDHLGAPQVLTDGAGQVIEQIRYRPFGEVRGRWDAGMRPIGAISAFGFAGYENEETSGLQNAGLRWYDPELGLFLSHDPARQFPSPYTYGGGDPVNGIDRAGALFGLDDLVVTIIIGALAGAAGAGINAAIHGASLSQALRAALVGGVIGGSVAFISAGVVAPALAESVVPKVVGQLASAGMSPATASRVAGLAIYGSLFSAGAVSTGYEASRGNYGPLIGFGVAIGLSAAIGPPPAAAPEFGIRRVSTAAESQPATLSVSELQVGDVLITRQGAMARVTEHAAVIVDVEGELVRVLSADNRGVYFATNHDPYVGGRQWDVFRIADLNARDFRLGIRDIQTGGGLSQYLGNKGGNVCSAVVASAIDAGGGPAAPRSFLNLITPQSLRRTYGPPIGTVSIPLKQGGI